MTKNPIICLSGWQNNKILVILDGSVGCRRLSQEHDVCNVTRPLPPAHSDISPLSPPASADAHRNGRSGSVMQILRFILQFIHLKRCIISVNQACIFLKSHFEWSCLPGGFGPVMCSWSTRVHSCAVARKHLVPQTGVYQHLICIVWGSVNYGLQSYGPDQNWLCTVHSSVVRIKCVCLLRL